MRKYLPGLFIAATVVISFLVFERLPERMPSHWSASGEVDGYTSRTVGAFLLPVVALAIWGLLRFLPRIDPRRQNYQKFQGMYDLLIVAVIGFLCVMHLGILAFSLGYPIAVDRLIMASVAVLLIVLGNLLPRARPNWFVGLRTPWTLSSDRVWERTHRAGGYVFLAAGLTMLGTVLLVPAYAFHVVTGAAVFITLFVLGYSYFAWRQERGS
jgi:uncharacterized membrane protein